MSVFPKVFLALSYKISLNTCYECLCVRVVGLFKVFQYAPQTIARWIESLHTTTSLEIFTSLQPIFQDGFLTGIN